MLCAECQRYCPDLAPPVVALLRPTAPSEIEPAPWRSIYCCLGCDQDFCSARCRLLHHQSRHE